MNFTIPYTCIRKIYTQDDYTANAFESCALHIWLMMRFNHWNRIQSECSSNNYFTKKTIIKKLKSKISDDTWLRKTLFLSSVKTVFEGVKKFICFFHLPTQQNMRKQSLPVYNVSIQRSSTFNKTRIPKFVYVICVNNSDGPSIKRQNKSQVVLCRSPLYQIVPMWFIIVGNYYCKLHATFDIKTTFFLWKRNFHICSLEWKKNILAPIAIASIFNSFLQYLQKFWF